MDRTGHSLPCAPELEFPNQLGSFLVNLVLSKSGFNCKITLGFSSLSPLSSFLSSNAPVCTYLLAAPTHRASQLKSLLKQYLNAKDATLHAPALRACTKITWPISKALATFSKGLQGLQGWPTARVSGWWQIGWWNKINQCRKLKLNLTQTWGVCMNLDSEMHWSQNQWNCDDKLRKE